jgi:hypothetical protein
MSSIIRRGNTCHGISVCGRGVFTTKYGPNKFRSTYAGQHRDGYACGLGVATWPSGDKVYAEYGPDGEYDGRYLGRFATGNTEYRLYERGERKEQAAVFANGSCSCNYDDCAPDDPRLLALIAQVAPVEVHPAAQAPHPPLRPQAIVRWISRLVLPPAGAREGHGHRGASLMAVQHKPNPAAVQRTTTQ